MYVHFRMHFSVNCRFYVIIIFLFGLCMCLLFTVLCMDLDYGYGFYRAMPFSAKRGIAIACRLSVSLSVCLSVCNVGELWSRRLNSSKIISPLVSLGCSLFATPTWRIWSKGNTPKFGPKVTHPYWFERRRHSIANCDRMVTDTAQRSQWTAWAYRKLPSLFLMVLSLTPTTSPFPPPPKKRGFHMPLTYANGHISATAHDLLI